MSARYFLSALLLGAAAASAGRSAQPRAMPPPGAVIYACTKPDMVALTFDDGPYQFTSGILDEFAKYNAKATFFLNGHNWGSMLDYKPTVQRMLAEGHQIGHHTWSHQDLATLTADAVLLEMTKLEVALIPIIGKFPTYMRPPFFSYNTATLSIMGALGYHVIHANIDTFDYNNQNTCLIRNSIEYFEDGLDRGGSIVLAHDVHKYTAENLVPAMLASLHRRNLRAVTVGECLGDPEANWYRGPRDGYVPPSTPIGGVDTVHGTCGGENEYVCDERGPCCSQWGYCGDTAGHCGANCNPLWGTCDS